MRQLSHKAFERARQFIKVQARPLDQAMFEYRFEDGPAESVAAELARFRNDDGGFGHALEADVRTPSSSALATGIGLRILKELGHSADRPLVRGAVEYLLATFDDGAKVWRVVPRDANAFPHAPWWHDKDGSLARTFDDFLIIPRAEIVGLLHHYAAPVPTDWLVDVTEHTVATIETATDEMLGGGGDSLRYALNLAETKELPENLRERLTPRLRAVTLVIVSRDPEEWDSYCAPPLKVAPSPISLIADLLWDDLQLHLDYQIEHQTPEGAWDPVWTWGDSYPDVWEQAKQEWRGHLTLETLTALQAFGRIDTQEKETK
jgi:hypothetical protein